MADKDAKDRLRGLAEAAANFNTDSHIPIRRYFRCLSVTDSRINEQPMRMWNDIRR